MLEKRLFHVNIAHYVIKIQSLYTFPVQLQSLCQRDSKGKDTKRKKMVWLIADKQGV